MVYDTKHIKELLDSYYCGTSTQREERELREYFSNATDIPETFLYDAAIFRGFDAIGKQTLRPAARHEVAGQRKIPRLPLFAGAALAAAASIVAAIVIPLNNENRADAAYCYIDGKPVTDYTEAQRYTAEMLNKINENLSAQSFGLELLEKLSSEQ